MTKLFKRFLSVFAICTLFAMPAVGATNMPAGDVGNFGVWATENNRALFVDKFDSDVGAFQSEFQKNVLVKDYVPVEAKVGRAFIGGLSLIGEVLERSLVRFISIFLIIMFAFWTMFEAYHMMTTGGDAKKLWEEIVKKLIIITIWIAIIEQGPAQLFMWIMAPIITIGTYLSDLILNSVAGTAGVTLPDTCAAIHKYTAAHHTGRMLLDAGQTADLLCLPTRLSGFFYTAVAAGWQWMLAGIGKSAFTFIAGAVFVVIFIFNIWKFALMALGVIADLFFGILMLPFTAITQCFGGKSDAPGGMFGAPMDAFGGGASGKTSYAGYAGQIFNGFLDLFKAESLSAQIERFIHAMIYFVSLSIVIAVCTAILSGVVSADMTSVVPSLEDDGFMTVLIVGCLVAYLANKAGDIAKGFGGKIDDTFGKQVGDDIKKLWGNALGSAKSWIKVIRKK